MNHGFSLEKRHQAGIQSNIVKRRLQRHLNINKIENKHQLTGLCAIALRYSSSFITIGPFLYSSSLVAAKEKYSYNTALEVSFKGQALANRKTRNRAWAG